MELIDPSYDNSLPSSWSNINFKGSPDAINSATASIIEENLLFSRVFPNPFIETLYILFELDKSEFVTVDIFDLKGSLSRQCTFWIFKFRYAENQQKS